MKVVILVGGFGIRLSEEIIVKLKLMVEIGGKFIFWYIMKMYFVYGIEDFIICCGYKGYVIKEYFVNYFFYMLDVIFYMVENCMEVYYKCVELWNVILVDMGDFLMIGGCLKCVVEYVKDDEVFLFIYGDGVVDFDIKVIIDFYKVYGKKVILIVIFLSGCFGVLDI